MDDALIPRSMGGGTKMGVQIFAALAAILVIVSIICAFIKGSQQYYSAYIIVALSMGMLVGTTFMILRWIVSDEMPESKHTYVAGAQFFALIFMAAGTLASVYISFPGDNAVFGVALNALGNRGSVQLKGTAPDGSALDLSVPFSAGQPLFSFPQHIMGGSDYVLTLTDPDQSVCNPKTLQGTASGDVHFVVNCSEAYPLTVTVVGLKTSPVQLQCQEYDPSITQVVNVTQNGQSRFPTPILKGVTYSTSAQLQPSDTKCSITSGASGQAGPAMPPVVVTCV